MGAVNKQMNPQDLQRTMHNFEKESMKMDMSEEMSISFLFELLI